MRLAAGREPGRVPRHSSGRVGILDELCPHRLASLWLGRNEEDGLRCVYHGWKFDIEGNCIDQMNEPEQLRAQDQGDVPTRCYEKGGVIWTYMGPAERRRRRCPSTSTRWCRTASAP